MNKYKSDDYKLSAVHFYLINNNCNYAKRFSLCDKIFGTYEGK